MGRFPAGILRGLLIRRYKTAVIVCQNRHGYAAGAKPALDIAARHGIIDLTDLQGDSLELRGAVLPDPLNLTVKTGVGSKSEPIIVSGASSEASFLFSGEETIHVIYPQNG